VGAESVGVHPPAALDAPGGRSFARCVHAALGALPKPEQDEARRHALGAGALTGHSAKWIEHLQAAGVDQAGFARIDAALADGVPLRFAVNRWSLGPKWRGGAVSARNTLMRRGRVCWKSWALTRWK